MTRDDKTFQMVRRAAWLGREMANQSVSDHMTTVALFIQTYDPDRPCQWKAECVATGRCPREIACNN